MILRFEGDYEFLSNFHEVVIWFDGKPWASVEHAYQACKTKDPKAKEVIRSAHNAGLAKRLGRSVSVREDWDQVKFKIMKMLVSLKFLQHPDLREKLLATEGVLVEGNAWHDNFWGSCSCSKCVLLPGNNQLGVILMSIRSTLKTLDL